MQPDNEYLQSLNLGSAFLEAITSEIEVLKSLFVLDEVKHLFVSNPSDDGDPAEFTDLWAFTDDYWMWVRGIMTPSRDVDISPYRDSIRYLGVKYSDFEFPDTVNTSSRIQVEVSTDRVEYSTPLATGRNCLRLLDITRDLLASNLAGRT